VTGCNSLALPGATVTATQSSTFVTGTTDSTGSVTLTVPTFGTWAISVSAPDFVTGTTSVTFFSGTASVTVALAPDATHVCCPQCVIPTPYVLNATIDGVACTLTYNPGLGYWTGCYNKSESGIGYASSGGTCNAIADTVNAMFSVNFDCSPTGAGFSTGTPGTFLSPGTTIMPAVGYETCGTTCTTWSPVCNTPTPVVSGCSFTLPNYSTGVQLTTPIGSIVEVMQPDVLLRDRDEHGQSIHHVGRMDIEPIMPAFPECLRCEFRDRPETCHSIATGHKRLCELAHELGRDDYARLIREKTLDALTVKPPGLVDMASTFIAAATAQVLAGNPIASEAVQARRKALCHACPLLDKDSDRCNKCGCIAMNLKRSWSTSACPDGRWPSA